MTTTKGKQHAEEQSVPYYSAEYQRRRRTKNWKTLMYHFNNNDKENQIV